MNKESSLSFKNIFKRETKLAAYIIACMTVVVMSVSYALFFQVTNNSKNQVVESGELKFTYQNGNEIKSSTDKESICFQPMTLEEANLYYDECAFNFSVTNDGSLKANYSISLEPLEGNNVDPTKLKVILKKVTKSGETDGSDTLTDVSGFPKQMESTTSENGFELVKDIELDSHSTATYRVQIYVDEESNLDETEVGKTISYRIHGKGLVHEDQPISSDPNTPQEQETVFPNTVIDDQDEAGNGLVTQNHDDYAPTGGGSLEEGWKHSELRYVGPNPNNYVEFNGEENTWRIIGLVNVKTDSGITQRVKIIKDSIGDYSWDSSVDDVNDGYGVNEWSQADIMKLLNPGYEDNKKEDSSGASSGTENANNSLYWNGSSGTCYSGSGNSTTSCNFTKGLSESESYISDDIVWNTGSNGSNDYTEYDYGLPKHFYEYERSTNNGKICSSGTYCNDSVQRMTEWKTENGKQALVGLMYPSDYGYATSGGTDRNSCLDTEMYNWNSYGNCYNNDWLFDENNWQWTMSPNALSSNASSVFSVRRDGYVGDVYASNSLAVRPVVYLNSNVEIYDGEGTKENNFKLRVG